MTHRHTELIGLHPNCRLASLHRFGDSWNRCLCARVTFQFLDVCLCPDLVWPLLSFLCHCKYPKSYQDGRTLQILMSMSRAAIKSERRGAAPGIRSAAFAMCFESADAALWSPGCRCRDCGGLLDSRFALLSVQRKLRAIRSAIFFMIFSYKDL